MAVNLSFSTSTQFMSSTDFDALQNTINAATAAAIAAGETSGTLSYPDIPISVNWVYTPDQ